MSSDDARPANQASFATELADVPRVASSRRNFIQAGSATLAGLAGMGAIEARAAQIEHQTEKRRLLKTLKINMVKSDGSLTDKFRLAKEAGFDGIELNSPGINVEDTRRAIQESGLPVDGSVDSTHWKLTHSHPDPSVRKNALRDLMTAIRETEAVGGHTVLLVVGHGRDGSVEEVWQRSLENIRQALPLCGELGMTIAIENVWNHFLYEHDGPDDQTAAKFIEYVDELNSPWVGMQFDIGNHWKYGNPAQWDPRVGQANCQIRY